MPIFTAIGAAVSAIGGLLSSTFLSGTIGAAILKGVIGLGISLAAQALAGKVEPEKPSYGVQGQLQTAGDVPRSFPLGLTCTAGSLVWANTWGESDSTPNMFLSQVISLADLPTRAGEDGLVAFWCNGIKGTINWGHEDDDGKGHPVTEFENGGNRLWVRFYDGTQTAADPLCVNDASNEQRPYEATRVGRGIAYAVVTSRIDPEIFTGFPTFKFVLSGIKLYDPSKDSTNGGSGAQRYGTPSTWGGDGDHLPAVQLYNMLRGFSYGGKWLYGLQQLPAARLPASHWVAQISKCRAVSGSGDKAEPTYRAGGEVLVDKQVGDTVEQFLTACQGRLAEIGGIYELFVGAPEAPSFLITDDVILSTEEQSFTPFFGLADSITGIAGKFPSQQDAWNLKPVASIFRADLEERAGQRRLMADVTYDFVPYYRQVQRLMKSAIQEAERERRHTIVLPPEFWPKAVPGAVFEWTSAENGYITKSFRIDGVVDRANLDVMIDATEVDPSDYDWDDSTDYRTPVDGSLSDGRPAPQAFIAWAAKGIVVSNGAGKGQAGVELTWGGNPADIKAVRWEIRRASDKVVVNRDRTDAVDAFSAIVTHNIFSDTDYEARGIYVPSSGRKTLWSDWLPFHTPAVPNNDVSAELDQLNASVTEMLEDRFRFFEDAIKRTDGYRLEELTFRQEDIVFQQHFQKEFKNTKATYDFQIAQISKDNYAMSAAQTVIAASLKDAKGDIVAQAKTIQNFKTEVKKDIDGSIVASAKYANGVVADLKGQMFDKQGRPVYASASSFQVLDALVRDDKNGLLSQASRIDKTFAEIYSDPKKGTKSRLALSSSVDEVKSEVKKQGDTITSTLTDLKVVQANTPFGNASGLMGFELASAPKGVASRFQIMVKATAKGLARFAGFFMDVTADGKSMITLVADQLRFASGGDANSLRVKAFKFEDNKMFLDQLFVRMANIIDLTVTSAMIGVATIKELNLEPGANTEVTHTPVNQEFRISVGQEVTLCSKAVQNKSGDAPVVRIQVRSLVTATKRNGVEVANVVEFRIFRDSTPIVTYVPINLTDDGQAIWQDFDAPRTTGTGTITYSLRARFKSSNGSNALMRILPGAKISVKRNKV